MELGYTQLHRKIWNNKVLQEKGKRFSRLEAWLWLVNVEAQGIDRNGLKRGEFEASYRYLAKSWNWSLAAVQRFLSDLAQGQDPMITRVIHSSIHSPIQLGIHFIICKYETYNPLRYTKRYTKRYTSRYKLNKEEISKKEREIKTSQPADAAAVDPLPSVESYELSEKLRRAIQVRDPKAKAGRASDTTHWARDIDLLMRIDCRRAGEIEAVIAWCQKPECFWGPNILSGKKLREKFDTLHGQMKREQGEKTNGNSGGNRQSSAAPNSGPKFDPDHLEPWARKT